MRPSASLPDGIESQVLDWLAAHEEEMLNLLRTLVNLDSNSYDKAGVDTVGEEIRRFLAQASIHVHINTIAEYGDVIRTEVQVNDKQARTILLMGHRDTVFPTGTVARRPFRIENGRAYGPGVADMKSGLVMNSFVTAAFARFGGAQVPLVNLFTGDEEIGSPASRPFIEQEAKRAWIVFNAEAGRASGNVVVERRGCIFIRLEVQGRSAHSGVNFNDGRSAIEELAHKIIALQSLSDQDRSITVNVGLVSGGQSVNTVPPGATAHFDVRYFHPADRGRILEAVSRIVELRAVSDTTAYSEIYGEFLPLNRTPRSGRLFNVYRKSAADIGLHLDGEFTSGAADSGFAASFGVPTLCGVGPVGGRYHSEQEYLDVASLVPRAQALALAILRLVATPTLLDEPELRMK